MEARERRGLIRRLCHDSLAVWRIGKLCLPHLPPHFCLCISSSPPTMASVMVPVLYLALVVGSLLVFSSFYRRRAAGRSW
jgi:hypothetical protein